MQFSKFIKPLLAILCASVLVSTAHAKLVVGGKNYTEQQLLTSMTTQYLQAKGYEVDRRSGLGTSVLRKAQENGQVDLYWEYTGTSLITFNRITEPMSAEETYNTVKKLDAEKGLVWLQPSEANNTYALAMRREEAESLGIKTLSDLAAAYNSGSELLFASNAEFAARADGLKPLQKEYGFKLKRPLLKRMDSGLTYQALRTGQVNVALVFATDGRIPAFDFVVLQDDKAFFPTYAATPVIRAETLEKHPELEALLNELSGRLNDQVMAELNARVDVERQTIEATAKQFLEAEGLL